MAFRKPKDYDNVRIGGFKVLPADGYVCRILKAEETESKTQRPMLKIAFDIEEGEYAGYFRTLFNERRDSADEPSEVKWPFSGTKWILLLDNEGATNRDFKSFCTALEDSGTSVWRIDDTLDISAMKDAKVGIIFRREEHEYNNQTSWRTVPWGFRSVTAVQSGDYSVPEDKALSKVVSYDMPDSFSAAEDDIPF